jgi:hypothetical protein
MQKVLLFMRLNNNYIRMYIYILGIIGKAYYKRISPKFRLLNAMMNIFKKKKKKSINVKQSLFWNLNTCNDKILCKENCFNFVLKRKSTSLSPNANNYRNHSARYWK